jgi:hypothetical protein
LPVAAFVALVIATIGAFFVTQALKVTTPLIAGFPAPVPATINPVGGGTCRLRDPRGLLVPTSYRRATVSFYLLHRADSVDVAIVKSDGTTIVDTLASGRHMRVKDRVPFTWNGREADGAFAPDGIYYIRVYLIGQGRTLLISNQRTGALEPITVQTGTPPIRVTGVTAAGEPAGAPAMIPQAAGTSVTIHFTGDDGVRPRVLIYRTDLPGRPRLVKSFAATAVDGRSLWNGTLAGGATAPQGTYLVGLRVTDHSCTTGRFPAQIPPAPGSTLHAGVTVRYLAAEPPLVPVAAGATAAVAVDARGHAYRWKLRRAAAAHVLGSGSAAPGAGLAVRLPPVGPGLFELTLRWGTHRTTVPLIEDWSPARAGSARRRPRVLVVLPALTWQGRNPVDDEGDGIPDTLAGGEPVRLARPLVDGLPAGFGDEAALVAYLRRAGLPFDLTTDLALIDGVGPRLRAYAGVVLAGTEEWIPASLGATLSTYVEQGGNVLSLGIGSLLREVTISGGEALDPTAPTAVDALLARPGPLAVTHGALILVDSDGLGIFSQTSPSLRGYSAYQPIEAVQAPASLVSAAGVTPSQTSIAGYRLGRGAVVDIGLPGFASSLATNLDARQLLAGVWSVLSR